MSSLLTVCGSNNRSYKLLANARHVDTFQAAYEIPECIELDSGTEVSIETRLVDQVVRARGVVVSCHRTVARKQFVVIDTEQPTTEQWWRPDRRGSRRFPSNTKFNPHCTIVDPLEFGQSLIAKVTDLSIAGLRCEVAYAGVILIPGQRVTCQVQLPCTGQLNLKARVAELRTVKLSPRYTSLHLEFVRTRDHDIQAIFEYIVRFASVDDVDHLVRSQALKHDVSHLFSFETDRSPEEPPDVRRAPSGAGETTSPSADERRNELIHVAVKLGVLHVATLSLRPPDTQHSASDVSQFWHRDELIGIPGARVIESFVKQLEESRMAQDVTGCDEWREFVSSATSHETSRWRSRKDSVSWSNYAASYDVMCAANPAYSDNVQTFLDWLRSTTLPPSPTIADLGAGTGNYIVEISKLHPEAKILHLERDPIMNRLASRKYKEHGIGNVSFVVGDIDAVPLEETSVDLVLMVNSLYSLPSPTVSLRKVFRSLKPGGKLFVIDLGREMDVLDWTKYVVRSSVRTNGLVHTVAAFYRGRHAITQNRAIRAAQNSGDYWKHSSSEFRDSLETVGFDVHRIFPCYRGYCDAALCTRPGP